MAKDYVSGIGYEEEMGFLVKSMTEQSNQVLSIRSRDLNKSLVGRNL